MNINIYKTKEELSDKLSKYIINNHLNNSIALSGGSTPLLLFKNLNKKLANIKNSILNFIGLMRDAYLLILMIVIIRWLKKIY